VPSVADLLADLQVQAAVPTEPGNFGPVMLLAQDETLTRLVACWANVPPSTLSVDPRTMVPEGMPAGAHLRWLWALLEPDPLPLWLRYAGLPDAAPFRRLCWLAIDNRMVLPDGSVSQWASQYLSRVVARELGARG
jgi:hypothetical protein